MISLEGLKQSIVYMRTDIDKIRDGIVAEAARMKEIEVTTRAQLDKLEEDLSYFNAKRALLFDDAAYVQHEMDDNRDAMVLFCQ